MDDGEGVGAAGAAGSSRDAHQPRRPFWGAFSLPSPSMSHADLGSENGDLGGMCVVSAAQLPLTRVGDRCHVQHASCVSCTGRVVVLVKCSHSQLCDTACTT